MRNIILAVLCLLFAGFFVVADAQKKPAAYKLTAVKLTPFEQSSGEFEAEITDSDERSFFNEVSKMFLVVVEVSGEPGSYDALRKIEITVTEGKKVKAKKIVFTAIINQDGKSYAPMWIDAPLCAATTVSARIIGQTKAATIKRAFTVFNCGE